MATERDDLQLTERQHATLAAVEAARTAGKSLSEYAREHGLELRPLYDAMVGLRRRGLIPGAVAPVKRDTRRLATASAAPFIAIDVASGAAAASSPVTCRLRRPDGAVIECCAWPEPSWVVAVLAAGPRDAAT